MFNYSGSTLDNLLDFSVRHMFYSKKLSYNQTFYQTKFKIFLICLFLSNLFKLNETICITVAICYWYPQIKLLVKNMITKMRPSSSVGST